MEQGIPTIVQYTQDPDELEACCLPGSADGAKGRLTDGPVRCVLVAGDKGCPCGGTHVQNTSEIKKKDLLY